MYEESIKISKTKLSNEIYLGFFPYAQVYLITGLLIPLPLNAKQVEN